jgi:hypothetical protein
MLKFRLKFKAVSKKKKRENVSNILTKKKKKIHKKINLFIYLAIPKFKSKFKTISKKIKKENISNIFKLKKEMEIYKKNSLCNVKVQVQGHS